MNIKENNCILRIFLQLQLISGFFKNTIVTIERSMTLYKYKDDKDKQKSIWDKMETTWPGFRL